MDPLLLPPQPVSESTSSGGSRNILAYMNGCSLYLSASTMTNVDGLRRVHLKQLDGLDSVVIASISKRCLGWRFDQAIVKIFWMPA